MLRWHVGDDETTRRQAAPETGADQDKTVRYPATLRPAAATNPEPELAPPGLRSAPPPVPPPRDDDTLRGMPLGSTTPGLAPAPVPKAAFSSGGGSAPTPGAQKPQAKSPFKQTLLATPGLAPPPPDGPPSEPLREGPPEELKPSKRPSPYAQTLIAGQLEQPPPPPQAPATNARPPAADAPPALQTTLPGNAPVQPVATTKASGQAASAPPKARVATPASVEGKRSGTRPKTSAPPPRSGRPDAPSAIPALRLDDSDMVAMPTERPPGMPSGRGKMVAFGLVAAVLLVLGLWLAGAHEAAVSGAAPEPEPTAAAPVEPAAPAPAAEQVPAATPQEPEPEPEPAKPAPEAPKPKAAAKPKPKPKPAARAKARKARPKRKTVEDDEPAVELAPPPPVRSAEDQANIDDARSILQQLEGKPVIQMRPTDEETADRALQEAMGQPKPAEPPPPAHESPPAPVLELKPSE